IVRDGHWAVLLIIQAKRRQKIDENTSYPYKFFFSSFLLLHSLFLNKEGVVSLSCTIRDYTNSNRADRCKRVHEVRSCIRKSSPGCSCWQSHRPETRGMVGCEPSARSKRWETFWIHNRCITYR